MQNNIICPYCNKKIEWEFIQADFIGADNPCHCYHCNRPFTLPTEETVRIGETKNFLNILPVLEKGSTVRLINKEHPWHNEIGLICDKKYKSYRIEILGNRLWVPEDWVKETDEYYVSSTN